MEQKKPAELSDQELLQEQNSLKTSKLTAAMLIGLLLGVSVYGAVKNGFTFFTFFPLAFAFLLVNSRRKKMQYETDVRNEINFRNLH